MFFGLSAKGALTADMVRSMAPSPIIFAMANPDPEITPDDAQRVRDDVIIATGRSDYPNQVNNVLGFPYIFRGALDVRATSINMEMKIAAAQALAELAQEDVPDEVAAAYQGARPRFGRDYIIPAPFDPRLMTRIPSRSPRPRWRPASRAGRSWTSTPTRRALGAARPRRRHARAHLRAGATYPKRVVFAEGEEEAVIRAAASFVNQGLGTAVLVGREDRGRGGGGVRRRRTARRHRDPECPHLAAHQRLCAVPLRAPAAQGLPPPRLRRAWSTSDRNHFAACMVAMGDADAMVTGADPQLLDRARGHAPRHRRQARATGVIGVSIVLSRGRTVLVADTAVHDMPTSEELAEIAIEAARWRARLGYEPRVAMLAYSTFGHPEGERAERVREAVRILDRQRRRFRV